MSAAFSCCTVTVGSGAKLAGCRNLQPYCDSVYSERIHLSKYVCPSISSLFCTALKLATKFLVLRLQVMVESFCMTSCAILSSLSRFWMSVGLTHLCTVWLSMPKPLSYLRLQTSNLSRSENLANSLNAMSSSGLHTAALI